jgi:hypothetical protein
MLRTLEGTRSFATPELSASAPIERKHVKYTHYRQLGLEIGCASRPIYPPPRHRNTFCRSGSPATWFRSGDVDGGIGCRRGREGWQGYVAAE